jgi:hypothetical protein
LLRAGDVAALQLGFLRSLRVSSTEPEREENPSQSFPLLAWLLRAHSLANFE